MQGHSTEPAPLTSQRHEKQPIAVCGTSLPPLPCRLRGRGEKKKKTETETNEQRQTTSGADKRSLQHLYYILSPDVIFYREPLAAIGNLSSISVSKVLWPPKCGCGKVWLWNTHYTPPAQGWLSPASRTPPPKIPLLLFFSAKPQNACHGETMTCHARPTNQTIRGQVPARAPRTAQALKTERVGMLLVDPAL